MNYQKAANEARLTIGADSTPTSSAQIANGLIDTRIGKLAAYVSRAAATLGHVVLVKGLLFNAQDALTADTGSAQAGATKITSSVARFTTVGTAGDSAVLPVAAAGLERTVINASSTSMDVFPASGDAINGQSANAAFALAGGTSATFFSTIAGQWNTLSGLAATFSPSVTGTLSLTDSTTPAISLASGKTNTGTITISGKTSGSLILTTADATGQAVTIKPAAQTSGAVTLTTPDFAGVNDTFAFITKAQTLSNKTFVAPVLGVATGTSLAVTGLITSSSPSAGIGYATGAGVAGVQGTSRTTAVVAAGLSGTITLFSAAGSATPATFTFTNSSIAANDVVHVTQKTGTDKYEIFVTATGTGSCAITSFTTGGTTTEAPVFNFIVFKGVAS